ncbi:acetyl-CoA carboxylase biotin carboxyl carrier protein [Rubinisphaera margarita]|uniref:acetyl-CoA carboxylase biotin carboxyl carrier protein n=1 Tax=Rubinisphaera margarita TaxID=2909586 RepID=UPI001EE84A10|nr:acetyl-CoA carboxylase biotin carboxyl carrier protein [Rubinisphaera margarita]MCG6155125.1 acetyl-CoA carboxylase biotin carboxyl carrier protein [Rubinisphaera margarita]
MNDKPKGTSAKGSFDLAQLRQLIEMMEAHDVTEVNLRNGDEQWRLRRGPQVTAMPMPAMPAMPQAPAPAAAPAAAPASAAGAAAAPSAADEGLIEIKSPTVGTFYSSPSPDDPAFVKVGSTVSPDTTVCLVEAMKVFNQIPAECSGVIEKVLVKDGDAVDFNQPLFKVRPK